MCPCVCRQEKTCTEGSPPVTTADSCRRKENASLLLKAAISSASAGSPPVVFAMSHGGSCLFSALGRTVTHNTVGRLCTARSSARVTTLSMSAKCCSPWRGQKVGGSPRLGLEGSTVPVVSSVDTCSESGGLPCGRSPLAALILQAQEGPSQTGLSHVLRSHSHSQPPWLAPQPNGTCNRPPWPAGVSAATARVCPQTHLETGEAGLCVAFGPKP